MRKITLSQFIKRLEALELTYEDYENLTFKIFYSGSTTCVELIGERKETEQEYKKRLKLEKAYEIFASLAAKRKEKEERKLLKELKAKYEK